MPRSHAVKDLIIQLALQGKAPSEIEADLKSRGTPRTLGTIKKELSEARSKGVPIPTFNIGPEKENAKAKLLASRGGLSNPRLKARRRAAVLCLQGFTEEEIISGGECKGIDVKEILDVCQLMEPYRGRDDYLADLRKRNIIQPSTSTYREAAHEIEDEFSKKYWECENLKKKQQSFIARITDLEGEAGRLKGDLSKRDQASQDLTRERDEWKRSYKGVCEEFARDNKLFKKFGRSRLSVLLVRVDNLEATEKAMDENTRAAEEATKHCEETLSETKKDCARLVEDAQTRVRIALKTAGIPRETDDYIDKVVNEVYSTPAPMLRRLELLSEGDLYALFHIASWDLLGRIARAIQEARVRKLSEDFTRRMEAKYGGYRR